MLQNQKRSTMSHNLLFNATFHSFLIKLDQAFAQEVKNQGCPHCGGTLHQANYPRSPMGLLAAFREYYEARLSFCCNICRKRITPQTVRFFGRRWFPAPLFIIINILTLGINERRLLQIKHHFGIVVSESTWKRWRRWWRESFTSMGFWQQAKGLFMPPVSIQGLPRTLFNRFSGDIEEKLYQLLRFFSPLTGGDLRII